MDLGLAGEVAVIVGGARGIGRAIAVAFADEKASIALVDRDPAVEADSPRHRRPARCAPSSRPSAT